MTLYHNFRSIAYAVALGMMCSAPVMLTSCDDDDNEFDTNQYLGGINLNSFGPSPVARGGELRFLGSGMDQITKINIPGSADITDIQRISSEEIRITVPQDAEEGYVTLYYSGGTITTKTLLTYSEPISIEGISPLSVKPGATITISGEYLNLMSQVCFSFIEGGDSVNVNADAFITHERKQIVVVVPEEAVSGPVAVSDAAEVPNMVVSEEAIAVTLPSVTAPVDLTDAIPGSAINITGQDFDLVRNVRMPNGADVEFTYTVAGDTETLTFTLPEDVTDGEIVALPASGVEVIIATIGVVVPSNISATPAANLRAGDVIAISGENMDQVVSVTFPNVEEAQALISSSATKIEVAFPEMAQSGQAVLNLRSGKSVEIFLTTAKPLATGFSANPVSAAGELTIAGENLDLVVSVVFGGDYTVEVENAESASLTLTVPATAESGALTLNMANGEYTTTESLTIEKPACAFIPELPDGQFTAGDLFIVSLENADVLTNVLVNGSAVQYIINNGTLYISLPSSCGSGTVITLVSSNGEISYTIDVIPATHVEIIAYNDGPRDLGSWAGENDGGAFRIYKSVFEGVPSGSMLIFHVAPYGDYSQIQVNDANWGQFEILQFDTSYTTVEWELTAERLNHILTTNDGWSETGLVIQGCNTIISKVTIEYEQSAEETIWNDGWTCSGWNGNQDLAWGGYDWSSCKAGQTLRFYMTPTVADGDWWCISLRHGNNWANIPGIPTQYDSPEGGLLALELTADIIADLVDNGGLVITGDGFILNKITIE